MDRKVLITLICMAAAVVLLLAVLLGCSQEPGAQEVFNILGGADSSSPTLVSVQSLSSSRIRLEFSEPVKVYGNSFEPLTARSDGKFIYVDLDNSLRPGTRSEVRGRVKDYSGNTSGFTIQVWGYNPDLPQVLINEFTTKGTAKSPDRTELRILSSGNINGMTLYNGVPSDFDALVVFGDIDVRADDMVVVWWTEDISVPEVQEDMTGGRVFNICAQSTEALPSNNGALVLCGSPALGADVLDAVVYSNFSASYGGYGTRSAQERAKWVTGSGAWSGDPLDSTTSTATRSMGRLPDADDSDSAKDWIVTVTGGATFGARNSTEAF